MAARGQVLRVKEITREQVRSTPNTMFVFGDNMARQGMGGQAAAMRGEPNSIGVPTKWRPSNGPDSFFKDEDWLNTSVRVAVIGAFSIMETHLIKGQNVVIPIDGLGTGLADLPRKAPIIFHYIQRRLSDLENKAND